MENQFQLIVHALAALGIGLLIGMEREYGQRPRENGVAKHIEAAGIRTYALVALCGNLLTWLPEAIRVWGISLGLGFTAAIAIASYRRTSYGPHGDVGITSEIVLVLTFILGVLTGSGYLMPATIMGVVVFSLLQLKKVLHRFSHSLSKSDLRQFMQFLIVTVVILPILPDRAFGPYHAFNPHHIWLMVVLVSAIGFCAYTLIKIFGQRLGLGLTGVLGGLASSTAVTFAMSRLSRTNPSLSRLSAFAIVVACSTMFPRVLALSFILNPQVSAQLLWPTLIIVSYMAIIAVVLWRTEKAAECEHSGYDPRINPMSLPVALGFGTFYAFVLLLVHIAKSEFGASGVLTVAGFSGFTDVDAITLSLSKLSLEFIDLATAAHGILLACAVNTLVKLGIAYLFAERQTWKWLATALLPAALFAFLSMAWIRG